MEIAELHRLYLDCNSVCTDTRKLENGNMFFALKGENFNGNTYAEQALEKGAKYAVVDEKAYETSDKTILVDDVLKTLQKLATYHRNYLKVPIIALTGSNGKTTTKELINAVLSQNYKTTATLGNLNNHIGVPLTLLSMTSETEIGIVEMGANHQKEIEFLCNIAYPDYGLITNYGKAHLEGFGGIEGVIKGKSEMFSHLVEHDKTIFLNSNDPIQIEKSKGGKTVTFGNSESQSEIVIDFLGAQPFVVSKYKDTNINSQLIGDYNFTNIAIAIAIGDFFKVDSAKIKSAIECYIPSNNRSQIIEKGTNKIILDAYNANPTSMRAALLNFEKQEGRKMAILGDMFELGEDAEYEHQTIAELANSMAIDNIFLVGENFSQSEINSEKTSQFKSFEDFKEAFNDSIFGDSLILIKGSRGMALERVLELL
ncbi:UDP-N-acetylmuramoyl-tripeptide--D-alanyl-D-alanine ligase [Hyunsoonleella sp. SJ7]|uniref:UDP-N-acetylmuramoyl-tripeptide--D-alanyl-D-alanine ligase n=1 Tax=Hyunsoonleella aquatilis TaxID=2762758 RepID=A0A923KLI1_9FLAO|nr:UDP-N-acetylmuramoyl-tripeptide--D-alanyl-D-alanine ligase [Hyunsoonleella aquatilis]MBC3759502.1 UDP-N-acetylmuramoyl-tripeptide--D-alanyl-D-alanine ligase [Hyunsoonleella aquatilis]